MAPDDIVAARSVKGWLVTIAACALLVVCVTGSVAGAFAQRSSVRSHDRQAFRSTVSDVASSMSLAIRRNTEYVETLRSMLTVWPGMTNERFSEFVARTRASVLYPGSLGYIFLAKVPATGLAAFGRELAADRPRGMQGPFSVVPPGRRADYCIVRLGVSFRPGLRLPLGLDQCATAVPGFISRSPGRLYRAVEDSGEIGVGALDATHGVFGVAVPVYRGGVTPRTVAARRAALQGWAGGTFDGQAILAAAGGVKPGLRVTISHRNPGEAPEVLAAAGTAKRGSRVLVTPLRLGGGAWSLRVSGSAQDSGLSATAQFWIVLLTGLSMSGLLFAFVLVLARGRSRALRLVDRKTIELRHLSLHDPLTGLPNRALILDRIEQALARARRGGGQLAVMYLDLDEFKAVNDTFGHGVGDELLCAVGERLTGLVRESDTVGRLGGDEFVLVVAGDSLDARPEAIAGRIRQVLSEPFRLGSDHELVAQVGASVGIATGLRASADDLLRDADLALYAAKHGGKDRFALFEPSMGHAPAAP